MIIDVDNIIPIDPSMDNVVCIRGEEQDAELFPCFGVHKQVIVDSVKRTVTCEHCKFTVDPFTYLAEWAKEGDRRMNGLKTIEIQRRIAQSEHDDLMRKIKNLRQRLKRAGEPQLPVERLHFNMQRWNPSSIQEAS